MQRCIGLTSKNKRCRRKIFEPNKFFCCKEHEPKNNINNEVCFLCSDKINMKEVKILKCGHAFHKPCLMEWYNSCLAEDPNYVMECLICRKEVLKNNNNLIKNKVNNERNFYNSKILDFLYSLN